MSARVVTVNPPRRPPTISKICLVAGVGRERAEWLCHHYSVVVTTEEPPFRYSHFSGANVSDIVLVEEHGWVWAVASAQTDGSAPVVVTTTYTTMYSFERLAELDGDREGRYVCTMAPRGISHVPDELLDAIIRRTFATFNGELYPDVYAISRSTETLVAELSVFPDPRQLFSGAIYESHTYEACPCKHMCMCACTCGDDDDDDVMCMCCSRIETCAGGCTCRLCLLVVPSNEFYANPALVSWAKARGARHPLGLDRVGIAIAAIDRSFYVVMYIGAFTRTARDNTEWHAHIRQSVDPRVVDHAGRLATKNAALQFSGDPTMENAPPCVAYNLGMFKNERRMVLAYMVRWMVLQDKKMCYEPLREMVRVYLEQLGAKDRAAKWVSRVNSAMTETGATKPYTPPRCVTCTPDSKYWACPGDCMSTRTAHPATSFDKRRLTPALVWNMTTPASPPTE